MILSGSLVAVLAARFKPTNIFTAGLVGVGIAVGLMALVGNVWHVMAALFLVGLFIPPVNAASQTITQTAVPDEVRGRTGAARSALVNVANLVSMGAAGILAEAIGTRNVFVVGGLFVVFAGLLAQMIFRGVEIPSPKSALAVSSD
jgi:DHA3 family macrolide efflux protein-like MFS transporter